MRAIPTKVRNGTLLSCLLKFSMVVVVILDSTVFDSQSKDFYECQAKIEIYGIGYTCIFESK